MFPILYKYVIVYIKYYIRLHIHYIKRTYIGVARGGARSHSPSKFLEYLVILCFKSTISNKILLLNYNPTF